MYEKAVISFSLALILLISCYIFVAILDLRSNPIIPMLKSPLVASTPCTTTSLLVYMYDLPRRFNVGMLDRLNGTAESPVAGRGFPAWPENSGLAKQHSVEYWMMASLMYEDDVGGDVTGARRASDPDLADVFFVPFCFNIYGLRMKKHKDTKIDLQLQIDLMGFLRQSKYWQRSGGRDHVFPMTHPNAFRPLLNQVNESIQVVVDFGHYPKGISNLNKDVVSPYVHVVDSFTDDEPQDP